MPGFPVSRFQSPRSLCPGVTFVTGIAARLRGEGEREGGRERGARSVRSDLVIPILPPAIGVVTAITDDVIQSVT